MGQRVQELASRDDSVRPRTGSVLGRELFAVGEERGGVGWPAVALGFCLGNIDLERLGLVGANGCPLGGDYRQIDEVGFPGWRLV